MRGSENCYFDTFGSPNGLVGDDVKMKNVRSCKA